MTGAANKNARLPVWRVNATISFSCIYNTLDNRDV